MKAFRKIAGLLLLALVPAFVAAQENPMLVLDYMKVKPGQEQAYLDMEKTFSQIHKKKIEAGLIIGWQLWKKHFAAENEDYHYITISWYENPAQYFKVPPMEFYAKAMGELGLDDDFVDLVYSTRTLVNTDVIHQAFQAENGGGSKFIRVNRMAVNPENENKYMGAEWEIWKPLQEKAIEKGYMQHWSVYQAFPYDCAEMRYITVDGFESIEQMIMEDKEDLLPIVHPDKTWEELDKMMYGIRTMASVELWELVDVVWTGE